MPNNDSRVRIAKSLKSKVYHLENPERELWHDYTTICGRYIRTSIFLETAQKQNLQLCKICEAKNK